MYHLLGSRSLGGDLVDTMSQQNYYMDLNCRPFLCNVKTCSTSTTCRPIWCCYCFYCTRICTAVTNFHRSCSLLFISIGLACSIDPRAFNKSTLS